MVAEWTSAETGVGPSMASGSQMCSGNWALLPIAPAARPSANSVSIVWPSTPSATSSTTSVLMAAISSVPARSQIRISAASRPRSPRRVTMNAFLAAAAAAGRWNQKPIRKYEAAPTSSQKTNSMSRLSARIRPSMAAVKNDMKA